MRREVGSRRPWIPLIGLALLAGCAVNPDNRQAVAVYDFGLPAAPSSADRQWPKLALDVVAPPWFDALNVDYRLAYDDPLKQREYSGSRWAGTPGVLLAQRLRQRLGLGGGSGSAGTDCQLRFELHEFSQVFDSPTQSRGVLQGSASLIDARKISIAVKSFLIEKPAASQDARGGVDALVSAGSELATQLGNWLGTLEKSEAMARCQPAAPVAAKSRK